MPRLSHAFLLILCAGCGPRVPETAPDHRTGEPPHPPPTAAVELPSFPGGVPTFSRDVAPIVFLRCAPCHRPGEAAPFALLSHEDLARRSAQIALVVEERIMPPWSPDPGYGSFRDERRLSDVERATLLAWIDAGAPAGDPADRPPLPEFPRGWQLGEPDLVVRMPAAYALPASGEDVFRNFVIPTAEPVARWVRAVEFRPSNRRVVHHANLWTDASDASRRLDARDEQPGFEGMAAEEAEGTGTLVGWHPGRQPYLDPPDIAWKLEAGSDLLLLAHMLPTGKPETIDFTLGLHFGEHPPARHSTVLRLSSKTIDLPPGARDVEFEDHFELPVGVTVYSLRPHAHFLGKDLRAWATLPDGERRWLIRISDWDFNWQDEYRCDPPLPLPAGTRLSMRYSYDNSAENVRNPSRPPVRVRWGSRTNDEMGVLFLHVLVDERQDFERLLAARVRHERELKLAGWQKLLRDDPDDPTYRLNVAVQLQAMGRSDEALEHLREAVRRHPEHVASRYNLAGALLGMGGEPEQAVRECRAALALDPAHPESNDLLALILAARGELDAAGEHWRAALRSDPRLVRARVKLAELLHSRGALDEAAEHYRAAIEVRPETARALAGLASIERLRGDHPAAVEHFRRALAVDDAQPTWRHELGLALAATGAGADALAEFERAAQLRPDWPAPWKKSAWILATSREPALRDPARALEHAERARVLAQRPDASILDVLGAARAANGDFEGAQRALREALSLLGDGASTERSAALRSRLELYSRATAYVELEAGAEAGSEAIER